MFPVESGTPESEGKTMLVHFLEHITTLFERIPNLVGFSVQEGATLSADREAASLDGVLSVADVSVYGWPGTASETTGEEIAAMLQELLAEYPSARRLLSGYTFARIFH